MFGSLTPLILGISGLKSSTGIVFHQASRHAAYSPALTVLLCEAIKIVASLCLLARALHQQRQKLGAAAGTQSSNSSGYTRLQAEDFEVEDTEQAAMHKEAAATSPSVLEDACHKGTTSYPPTLWQHIRLQLFQWQGLRLIVPAVIYVIQNNLYLYAASELDPSFFQALWQMRILMSALLSWLVLHNRILPIQWLCISGIFAGVMLVKIATTSPQIASAASSDKTLTASLSLCAAALMSSTAGVLLEFVFRDRKTNLWASNVHLSCFSILPAACIVFFGNTKQLGPVLHDLHSSPWPMGVVTCQSFNGMMIAMLLKKAGVVFNDLSSAVAIVLTFILNELLFPETSKMDSVFDIVLVIAGSAVILASSMLYQRYVPKDAKAISTPQSAPRASAVDGLHLEFDRQEASFAGSVSSSSASSPAASSVATPAPRSPPGYFFDLEPVKETTHDAQPRVNLELTDLSAAKPSVYPSS